jgi:2-amino-4-hydroxy-6-hydroxymethyldihydropteridine diphosphokinase
MLWHPAYVGIGSNLDQPASQVQRALAALPQLPQSRLVLQSSLYGSKPLGPAQQPDFVNAVAALLTQLEAVAFFGALRALEAALGREPPRQRWGPRRIDLDLLLFDAEQLASPELTLPHPGIVQRNFVLYPLLEVAPELNVPGRGRVAELAARVDPAGIWRLDNNPKAHGA